MTPAATTILKNPTPNFESGGPILPVSLAGLHEPALV